MPKTKNLRHRIEIIAVVLIALSTISSAWCVYEAARWSGHQSFELSKANGFRSESVRSTDITTAYALYDSELFLSWVDAVAANQTVRAAFLRERFREDFRPAFDAWLASAEPGVIIPPGTPFALPEYGLLQDTESTRFREQADTAVQQAQHDSQISDDYVLMTVMFAMVLFLEGVSTRWESIRIQVGMVILAAGIFVVAMTMVVLLPVSFAF